MLSYFQFLLLSMADKKNYLLKKATFLLCYTYPEEKVFLCAVNDFFVEVHISQTGQITEIISFKDSRCLEKHAQHVDLAQLYT